MINVLIVDDHKIVTDCLELLLNESDLIQVIGKAYSISECWEQLKVKNPDVLLLDIGFPDGNGITVCPLIKQQYPNVKVMMMTSYGELTTINHALQMGADGYVLKNSMLEELTEGIKMVAAGKHFLCEEVNITLKNFDDNLLELTRREIELLHLIVEGYTLPELANKMCLGIQTIRSYRKNLNIKLNVHNTAQLIQKAGMLKLI